MLQNVSLKIASVFLILMALASAASAHDPSLSGIRIMYRANDAVVSVSTHISRLMQADGKNSNAPTTAAELEKAIRKRLHLQFDGKHFSAGKTYIIEDKANDLVTWQGVIDPMPSNECQILDRIYPEDPASRTVV